MRKLFKSQQPLEVTVRSKKIIHLIYGFADASGTGFGSSLFSSKGIRIRVGVWGKDDDSEESSNWKEFTNSVEALETEGKDGQLDGSLVFLNTDNSTVERVLYKGNSKSSKLHGLVMRVKQLEFTHNCKILVSHVSGLRMQHQGTDGLSRGTHSDHILSSKDIIENIPFDKSALDRSPLLLEWIKTWAGNDLESLSPEEWFTRGHDLVDGFYDKQGFWRFKERKGTFLWSPPPAAADVLLEELRKARIKRQQSTHIFICPRLLTSEWLKQLHKVSDIVFEIPPTESYWSNLMFEPLKIGICFPFYNRKPWQLRSTPKMFEMGRKMRQMSQVKTLDRGDILRKFFVECQRLSSMPDDVVRRMLYFQSRSEVPCQGREGSGRKRPREQSKDRGKMEKKKSR